MKWLSKFLRKNRYRIFYAKCSTVANYEYPSKEEEYTITPQYPPIERVDDEYLKEKERHSWYDKIKRQKTVEEKLLEVNVPRAYGWKCFMIHEGVIPFDNLTFTQFITRTHVIKTKNLPNNYDKLLEESSMHANRIKKDVVDSLEYQLHVSHENLTENKEEEDIQKIYNKIIVNELNRVITNSLYKDAVYLKTAQVDYEPRIEAFWQNRSMIETFVKKENKYGIPVDELPEEFDDRPTDKFLQYIGHPILQLRHSNPLPKLVDYSEANIFQYGFPIFEYDPHYVLGYKLDRRYLTNIPGFWPGDNSDFSLLSYHDCSHLKYRPSSYGEEDLEEALQCQAIFASFGLLMPLASYHGFSTYHDVTYPFVTQTVLTNGQSLQFAVYQLNTTEMHHENPYENVRSNICWITDLMPLFESYENGKIKGFNENVLKILIQFYLNQPLAKVDFPLNPYLDESIKYIANYEDDEKRDWLEKKIKHLYANKPFARSDKLYEVYDWERIFKIQFRMRPQEARRRPFELRQNPYHRSLPDKSLKYIPKCLRPDKHLPKWKQRKFEKTFFPE